jgi:hypothetical protein
MRDGNFKWHIVETYNLSDRDFDRLYEEFLSHFDTGLEDFVRHRHLELQDEGMRNDAIYRVLVREVAERRFPAGDISERRIRRIIYG